VVQSWDLTQIEATGRTRSPTVLETVDGARAIVIRLAPGQELGDHQVRERAWLTIVEGKHASKRGLKSSMLYRARCSRSSRASGIASEASAALRSS
jgi:hypothetical protein